MQTWVSIERKNGVVILERDDWERVCRDGWSLSVRVHKNKYRSYSAAILQKQVERGKKKNKKTPLARFILALKGPTLCVDHINRNPLDNRRENLRVCTRAQNTAHREKTHGSSVFKGVHFEKQTGRWRAEIVKDRKKYRLGRFHSEIDAALAYDSAARTYFGEYAVTNFETPAQSLCKPI